jgi:hypothetical protein
MGKCHAARIDPKDLLPRHLSGKPLRSKMADYAIYLNLDERVDRAILQLLRHLHEDDQNINQNRASPVRYRRITCQHRIHNPRLRRRRGESAALDLGCSAV